jgi:hypothetical protein
MTSDVMVDSKAKVKQINRLSCCSFMPSRIFVRSWQKFRSSDGRADASVPLASISASANPPSNEDLIPPSLLTTRSQVFQDDGPPLPLSFLASRDLVVA